MNICRKVIVLVTMCMMLCASCFAASTDKIHIDYYYGANCHICKSLEPFMQEIELKYKDQVTFKRYEVQKNAKNFRRFSKRFHKYFTDKDKMGTPAIEIENAKMLLGEYPVRNNLEKEITAALKAKATNTPYAPERTVQDSRKS